MKSKACSEILNSKHETLNKSKIPITEIQKLLALNSELGKWAYQPLTLFPSPLRKGRGEEFLGRGQSPLPYLLPPSLGKGRGKRG